MVHDQISRLIALGRAQINKAYSALEALVPKEGGIYMADKVKDFQVTETSETTETETFIEEVEVKRTRKGPSQSTASSSKKADSYRVIVPLLNIREKASLVAEILGTLQQGDVVDIASRTPKGFGKLADDEGYVMLEYLEKIDEVK